MHPARLSGGFPPPKARLAQKGPGTAAPLFVHWPKQAASKFAGGTIRNPVDALARLIRTLEECRVQRAHQRDIEHIEPDHRLAALALVIVPGPARRQNAIALVDDVLLAVDDGIGAD